ncbi:S-adenosyl-L-methionine-dependent methyltransferase [Stachybotrys elegans]|uniref:Protein arginine methyltransferase NDUFAF7 n=1 Tax=Stachybotrys elegans TaxID=80388 RepID=A0A8K0SRJ5_9HYPO|nr:S-adenosyl-L-methionine-dependent methyltransferase [Stachybotrys elegans]
MRLLFTPARGCTRLARPLFRPVQSFRGLSLTVPRKEERKWSTPLAKELYKAISATGPVPLATYMRMCLTGDLGGYYTGDIGAKEGDHFGTKGDFITSPEISQCFGEMIGIWLVAEWMSQGRLTSPSHRIQLIEIGPGRGTLMADILRTVHRFPAFASSIDTIYMVEASRELAKRQKNLLCGEAAPLIKTEIGQSSVCKQNSETIVWTDSITAIPNDDKTIPFVVAHEFFDALPIHVFQSVSTPSPPPPTEAPGEAPAAEQQRAKPKVAKQPEPTEWREMLVAPVQPGTTPVNTGAFRSSEPGLPSEFQLVLSSAPTKQSLYMPEASSRYKQLKKVPGSVIEICPDAAFYAGEIARRIGDGREPKGAALILDYGTESTIPINSLRGIREHKFVDPFTLSGLVDLSADVDFMAVTEAALEASEGVEVHGPVCQADFLELMGIKERVAMLVKHIKSDTSASASEKDEKIQNITEAWKRLVDRGPNGMGKLYKALAIIPENDGRRAPVGFGGDLAQAQQRGPTDKN